MFEGVEKSEFLLNKACLLHIEHFFVYKENDEAFRRRSFSLSWSMGEKTS